MAFRNEVAGGNTLVRPALQSANYVPGVSGWRISRDGSSEFASAVYRGPVIVIDPATQNVLASIGATGVVSGQMGVFNDVLVGQGISVAGELTARPRGIIGYWDIGATPLPALSLGAFGDVAYVRCNWDASRVVRVTTRLLPIQTSSLTYDIITSRWIYSSSTVSSITFGQQVQSIPSASGGGTQYPDMFQNIAYFADSRAAANGGRATFRLQAMVGKAGANWVNGGWGLIVEDIGPLSAVTTYRDGGLGTPSGTTQYTKQYFATASGGFDGNGNNQGISNVMYTGNPGGSPGPYPQRGMWTFDGNQIRSDLTSATLNSATLTLYCLNSTSTSGGGCSIGWLSNPTIPISYPGAGSGGGNYTNWPVPGYASVDVLADVGSQVLSGVLANSIMLTVNITLPQATWAGYSSAHPPFLTISYTK